MALASRHPSFLPPTTFLLSKWPKGSHPPKPFLLRVASSSSNPPSSESPSESAAPVDPVKLAFEKARAYKKSLPPKHESELEASVVGSPSDANRRDDSADAGLKGKNGGKIGKANSKEKMNKEQQLVVSSMDFVGLDFADKKRTRGLPPGLIPLSDPFPKGNMPEVEIILGDTTNFDDEMATKPAVAPPQEDNSDLYKPKVSSWGVFPRPSNISEKFGGGRTIRPGEVLETAEDRAAKDAHTRELVAAYNRKMGLNIDAKLKSECEKALKDGDSLMDVGKLTEALPFYEEVMNKMPFQSELHGVAALQWSICQDSLTRPNVARTMYEKLQSHPNGKVSKRATQFMFSFQAMEKMKVRRPKLSAEGTGYQNYFEAFIEDKSNYRLDMDEDLEEGALSQAFPYIVFLLSPIFVVLFIAVQRGI
ncbi:uncharacterized protein LOC115756544 isoform X2 [Rhodamnia argentea]|uniref:Uncharacterized protein LOC115756544 isoform X2 n=1 Tax=Rhodamnia argentea TaxID=178133 RepID=A0ABM3HV95_9MYRT|nr:uncharacterized protein LOC115756544 isoform X2 [Rhodamnia argentea]